MAKINYSYNSKNKIQFRFSRSAVSDFKLIKFKQQVKC